MVTKNENGNGLYFQYIANKAIVIMTKFWTKHENCFAISGSTKAGFTGETQPSLIIPSVVGQPRKRYEHLVGGKILHVGPDALAGMSQLSLTYPIDHGHIDDWLEIEELWKYTFTALGVNPSQHPILLTEPPLCSSRHREKMAEIIFEVFNSPELNISVTGLMAIHATGQLTGCILDIGEGVTQCTPVIEGFLGKESVQRSDFGGQELNLFLNQTLCEMGYTLTTRDEYEYVREIKEKLCFCSRDPATDALRNDLTVTYTLPDGNVLKDGSTMEIVMGPECLYPAEALFNPQLCSRDNAPLTDIIWNSLMVASVNMLLFQSRQCALFSAFRNQIELFLIVDSLLQRIMYLVSKMCQACPLESRRSLLGSVYVCGGSTMFEGFRDRLEDELRNTAPSQARHNVQVISRDDRKHLGWIGASIFCNPSTRESLDYCWTSREEWNEIGARIIHAKSCPNIVFNRVFLCNLKP
ncbi:actin like protein ALP1 [Cardiosporidium cionae]|uniref:Actin like protein ALP1 n=1 Tax=Cardiosporidium cionae TaxID=476202 RepID=A0ABQ7JFK9_9APIC|nr:actin like protein ALP1 [Cardiosporidium cionae]|eukprot:KAF8822660.1 actin like protein ALP1 [Cardiosporidium cionae]